MRGGKLRFLRFGSSCLYFLVKSDASKHLSVDTGEQMSKQQSSPTYLAYLIRLWCESPGVWRGALENPHTGEQRAFADVESLLAYIQTQTNPVNMEKRDE
jgi:hypothetical protein